MHQLLEPVLRHEISRHERDPSRVQAGLFQHQAFCLLRLRGIDLEAVDCFRHPVGSCVPACAENHQLINGALMAGQSSIEEGRPGSRLLRHLRVSLKGIAVDPGHVAGQAMCQERPSRDEA